MKFDSFDIISKIDDSKILYQNAYSKGKQDTVKLIIDDLLDQFNYIDSSNKEKINAYKEAINIVKARM